MEQYTLVREIRDISKKKNALILAHNYQNPEIQDIAHYNGDSLELARIAAKNDSDIIVFCGVHFMAESAAILSPHKKVIMPDVTAGCPMADMARPEDVEKLKAEHPGAVVVSYINTSAAVKAVSDVICTSANAKTIVQRIDAEEIIFVPDKNLGRYVQRFTDKKVILWKGYCPTHDNFTLEELERVKSQHPHALVMVHPECRPEVIDHADETLSTGQMVSFVRKTDKKEIIVGTEAGMLHRLKKEAPHIQFIPASEHFICPDMKKINIEKLRDALMREEPIITVDDSTGEKARKALDAMLAYSS